MENPLHEYEVSIRIRLPKNIAQIIKSEKMRFVDEYGSKYASEPHITLYLDRYTSEGFPRLIHDMKELGMSPFSFSLLKPEARREEVLRRILYVINVSNKQQIDDLHVRVSQMAMRYQSPLLRSKVQRRLKLQGVNTDGIRSHHEDVLKSQKFDPHITLGEVSLEDLQPSLADVQNNLQEIEGMQIAVSEFIVCFYAKTETDEKFTLIEEVPVRLARDQRSF